MKMLSRECMLGIATLAAVLIGLLFPLGSVWLERRQGIQAEQEVLRASVAVSQELATEREVWEKRMAERQDIMPVFPQRQRMDLHWLSTIESIAARHQLEILRHETGEERQQGEVYELPFFVRQWEGTIDALIGFLHDIEREGALLDVRYLHVRPRDQSIWHGRFDLYAAYRRES